MLKDRVKIIKDFYGSVSVDKLKDEIVKYDCISFDLFDTLVKRHVCKAEDVFSLTENTYNQQHKDDSVTGFCELRKKAEKTARKTSPCEEVTLQEIYNNLNHKASEELKHIELDIEYEMTDINPKMTDIFNLCVNLKKRILIITDIYLPSAYIKRLLEKCKLNDIENVYVSCEIGLTKRTGKLFEYVMKKEKIASDKMLHLGDSYESDYIGPKRFGIAAKKIRRYSDVNCRMLKLREQDIRTGALACFFKHKLINDFYYDWGYKKFGVFLWQYIKWLRKELEDEGITNVYFFSRDGYIMKQAFDTMYQNGCKSHYLEVSRRSLRVPILWMQPNLETIIDMISPSQRIAIMALFDGVGLDISAYEKILKKYGFSEESHFYRTSILKNENLINLFEELKPDIISNSKKEYECLKQYLQKRNLSGKIGIVDIGWSGGMQRYLMQTLKTLGIECEIYGYYTGIAKYVSRNTNVVKMNMKGYLFDFHNNSNSTDERAPFVGLFETLFLEQRGSVEKYIKENDDYIAKRYQYEYLDTKGKVIDESAVVQKIQQGALQFVKDIQQYTCFKHIELEPMKAFSGIQSTGNEPTTEELKRFSEIRFFDEGECNYLAKCRSLVYYIFHLRKFKNDFLKSRWKTAFLKSMLKVPLPYRKIYNFMLKMGGGKN